MAQIPQYVAQQSLQAPPPGQAKVDMTTGAVLQDVGNALTGLFERRQERAKQRDALAAKNGFEKMKIELGQQLQMQQETMPEDGSGFLDTFTKTTFEPQRDAFLATIKDPELRQQYQTLLDSQNGSEAAAWAVKAATVERDKGYEWAGKQIGELQNTLATMIGQDPDAYDQFFKEGMDAIDVAPMTTKMKSDARDAWEKIAQVAWLDRTMQTNPELVIKALDANPNLLGMPTKFALLSKALQVQESGGEKNPDQAISPAGALGRFQVMPGTAMDIAKWLGDKDFPRTNDPAIVAEYVMRPSVNRRYGEFYLQKQLKDFNGDLEAALIAYNGGPGRAKEWLAADRNDSVLPKETRDYYKQIMNRLPGATPAGNTGVQATFVWTRDGSDKEITADSPEMRNVNPDLARRVQAAYSSLGIKNIRVNSAFRDKATNDAVGGASGSEHLHGNAFDLNVTGMSVADRKKLILALSAMGIGGIGVGNNIIHADIGGRRAWSYDSSGKWIRGVPQEYQDVIGQHLAGKATAPGSAGGRFASLDYSTRQKYISSAATAVEQGEREAAKATDIQKFNVTNDMNANLDLVLRTGQDDPNFDPTQVATVLGNDDYLKYLQKRDTNQQIFKATDGMALMDDAQIDSQVDRYRPDPKSSANTIQAEAVGHAVQVEADRIRALRARDPAGAALEDPKIKAQWDQISTNLMQAKPEQMQQFVHDILQRQAEFNLKPTKDALTGVTSVQYAPVPRQIAYNIGAKLATIPIQGQEGYSKDNLRVAIKDVYDSLHAVLGPYTDEVMMYSLKVYHGMDETTATAVAGAMQSLARGKDPADVFKTRPTVEDPADNGETSFFKKLFLGAGYAGAGGPRGEGNWLWNSSGSQPGGTPAAAAGTSEQVQAAITKLEANNDEATQSEIVRLWGEDVLKAALEQIGN